MLSIWFGPKFVVWTSVKFEIIVYKLLQFGKVYNLTIEEGLSPYNTIPPCYNSLFGCIKDFTTKGLLV